MYIYTLYTFTFRLYSGKNYTMKKMGVVVVNFLAKNLATVTNGFNYSSSLAWGSLRIFWSILLDIKYAQKYTICGLFIWLRHHHRKENGQKNRGGDEPRVFFHECTPRSNEAIGSTQ